VNYLLDTNVISEIRKGDRCNVNVATWYASVGEADVYLSVLVLGEIRKGIEKLRAKHQKRAGEFEMWLSVLRDRFGERVFTVDQAVADEWGRMSAGRSVPATDALIAATAKVHQLTVVTRNLTDVADLGVEVLNPFEAL
jgi:hypothetical protein